MPNFQIESTSSPMSQIFSQSVPSFKQCDLFSWSAAVHRLERQTHESHLSSGSLIPESSTSTPLFIHKTARVSFTRPPVTVKAVAEDLSLREIWFVVWTKLILKPLRKK